MVVLKTVNYFLKQEGLNNTDWPLGNIKNIKSTSKYVLYLHLKREQGKLMGTLKTQK